MNAPRESTQHGINGAISRARQTLMTVQMGLDAVLNPGDLGFRIAGIQQIIVFGRSITNVLQTIRAYDRPGFDAWYERWKIEMMQDELCQFFYKKRSEVIKEGKLQVFFETLKADDDGSFPRPLPGPPRIVHRYQPPGGPEVAMWIRFFDQPQEHLGENIRGEPMEALCRRYVDYLRRMVSNAAKHFDSPLAG